MQNCSAGGCFLQTEVPADPQKGQEGAGDRGRAKGEPQTRDCSTAPASDLGYHLGQACPFLASISDPQKECFQVLSHLRGSPHF